MKDEQVEQILQELCQEHGVSIELMLEMLEEERDVRHLKQRRGVTERLRAMMESRLGVEG